MAEEEKKPETKKEEKAMSILEQIKAERTAVEEANKVAEERIAELRELRGIELLSGKSEAGIPPEKPKEETPKEYAQRVMSGGLTPANANAEDPKE